MRIRLFSQNFCFDKNKKVKKKKKCPSLVRKSVLHPAHKRNSAKAPFHLSQHKLFQNNFFVFCPARE